LRDALYVGLNQWEPLIFDVSDRFMEPDMEDRNAAVEARLLHLAVPAALLRTAHGLTEIFDWFYQASVLYVIIGEQQDQKEPRRWEFEDAEQGVFIKKIQSGDFIREDGEYNSEETLYTLVDEFINALRRRVGFHESFRLEIRPVFAVRR
jgi:hypothetical protein